jgi:transposase
MPQGRKLSKIGTIKAKLHCPIVGNIKTCIVKREPDNWYECFSVEYTPIHRPASDKAVGTDVGIINFAILSTGEAKENSRHQRTAEKKLKKSNAGIPQRKKDLKTGKSFASYLRNFTGRSATNVKIFFTKSRMLTSKITARSSLRT